MRAVWIAFLIGKGMMLTVNRDPLAGVNAGRHPEAGSKDPPDHGMQDERTVRGGTVKVTVVEDETGGRKIALEAIADEVPPAKPGKASRKRTAVAADGSEIEDDQIDEDDGDEDGDDPMSAAFDEETAAPAKSRAGSVPKVPRRSN